METMSFAEFEEKYLKNQKKFPFGLFSIVCKKCGSSKVEYNSDIEVGNGYYDDYEIEGGIVIKCHDCGNATKIDHGTFID